MTNAGPYSRALLSGVVNPFLLAKTLSWDPSPHRWHCACGTGSFPDTGRSRIASRSSAGREQGIRGPCSHHHRHGRDPACPRCDHHSSSPFAIENNWVRPHPPKRPPKIGIWIEKFRCQNSNLNLPTIKNGFYGYSYLKDLLRILKRICAQFWNRWVIPVT